MFRLWYVLCSCIIIYDFVWWWWKDDWFVFASGIVVLFVLIGGIVLSRILYNYNNTPITAVSSASANTQFFYPYGIPDLQDLGTAIEPIVSKRYFHIAQNLDGRFVLISGNRMVWPYRKPMRASCGGVLANHESPSLDCPGCGIYSITDEAFTVDNWSGYGYAVADLAIWGKVIICQLGYRSEYAYPQRLVINLNTRIAHDAGKEIADSYGIPVRVGEVNYIPTP